MTPVAALQPIHPARYQQITADRVFWAVGWTHLFLRHQERASAREKFGGISARLAGIHWLRRAGGSRASKAAAFTRPIYCLNADAVPGERDKLHSCRPGGNPLSVAPLPPPAAQRGPRSANGLGHARMGVTRFARPPVSRTPDPGRRGAAPPLRFALGYYVAALQAELWANPLFPRPSFRPQVEDQLRTRSGGGVLVAVKRRARGTLRLQCDHLLAAFVEAVKPGGDVGLENS